MRTGRRGQLDEIDLSGATAFFFHREQAMRMLRAQDQAFGQSTRSFL